jgi:uncharacterized protein YbjT (DUF2867 family)
VSLKTALVFGSSGLTGSALVRLLLASEDYHRIKVFVRKSQNIRHPKLEEIVMDFDKMEILSDQIKGDDIFLCLGTTMAKAGSKAAFFKVDYTYNMTAARIASQNKVSNVILISSMGADSTSMIYYSKVKGKVENDLSQLPFKSIAIVRPSLLLGDRKEQRIGEKIGSRLSTALSVIFVGPLKKYKAIMAETVAKSMIKIASESKDGVAIYESDELEKIGNF